jgi:predicted RNA-binding Zn-ribbon protein involved in translation (DUF1610 family)
VNGPKRYDTCPDCGERKKPQARQCLACYKARIADACPPRTCVDCGARVYNSAALRCLACHRRQGAVRRAARFVCPDCGGRKNEGAARCWDCQQARRRALRGEPKSPPRPCPACGQEMAGTSAHCWRCSPSHASNPFAYTVVETPAQWRVPDYATVPEGTCGWCHGPMLLRATYPRQFCGAVCAAAWHALDVEREQAQQELRDAWHWWIRTHPAYSSQAFRAAVAAAPRQEAA